MFKSTEKTRLASALCASSAITYVRAIKIFRTTFAVGLKEAKASIDYAREGYEIFCTDCGKSVGRTFCEITATSFVICEPCEDQD